MNKHTKIKPIFTALLVAVFALGSVGVGIAASRISNEFQANAIQNKKLRRKTSKLVNKMKRRLVAQSEDGVLIQEAAISCIAATPENPEYKGEFVVDEIPAEVEPGEDFSVSLYVKNTGNTTWFGDSSNCQNVPYVRLGTARERDRGSLLYFPGDSAWVANNRITMTEARVEPGETATFTFETVAPEVIDIFKEYFQPLVEGVQWMETPGTMAHVDVIVGEHEEEMMKKAFFLGESGQASQLDISGEPLIDVDISDQTVKMMFGQTVVREYRVSTGTFRTPTPLGRFTILTKQELRIAAKKPHYRMPYFQLITRSGVGFHSLPYLANDKGVFWKEALSHIGQRVSHGCIRLLPDDAVEFYGMTQIAMPVAIHN